jgi:hypothetical protein
MCIILKDSRPYNLCSDIWTPAAFSCRKQEPCLKINDNDNIIEYTYLRAGIVICSNKFAGRARDPVLWWQMQYVARTDQGQGWLCKMFSSTSFNTVQFSLKRWELISQLKETTASLVCCHAAKSPSPGDHIQRRPRLILISQLLLVTWQWDFITKILHSPQFSNVLSNGINLILLGSCHQHYNTPRCSFLHISSIILLFSLF